MKKVVGILLDQGSRARPFLLCYPAQQFVDAVLWSTLLIDIPLAVKYRRRRICLGLLCPGYFP